MYVRTYVCKSVARPSKGSDWLLVYVYVLALRPICLLSEISIGPRNCLLHSHFITSRKHWLPTEEQSRKERNDVLPQYPHRSTAAVHWGTEREREQKSASIFKRCKNTFISTFCTCADLEYFSSLKRDLSFSPQLV